jgi:FkbM family methyltransferase
MPDRSINGYRFAVVVLLGVILALSWALREEEKPGEIIAALPSDSPGTPAPPPDPKPPGERVTMVDLAAEAEAIGVEQGDAVATLKSYYRSPLGSVYLHVLNEDQSRPLHLQRFSAEVAAVIAGRPSVLHAYGRDGKVSKSESRYGAGTVIQTPAHCGQRWHRHPAEKRIAYLEFSSPPFDGDIYLEGDDQRFVKGSAPSVFDPEQEIEQLLAAGKTDHRLRTLGMMGGKLSSLATTGTVNIEAVPGPSILFVARGQGELTADRKQPIRALQLVYVKPNTPLVVRPEDGPLVLLLFRPEHDGVSDLVKKGKKLYSYNNEELLIREFFNDRGAGFFLDVGAGHYKRSSTTFYLEEQLGWSGVAVDALAEYAPDYLKYRPRTKFVSYLVTDKSRGVQKFYKATAYPVVSAPSRKEAEIAAKRYSGDGSTVELEVPSITLTELLDQLGIKKIDFISIDIEGHEMAGLNGFDIDRFRPELVCVEARAELRNDIPKYFSDHHYVRINRFLPYDPFNWYFTPEPGR